MHVIVKLLCLALLATSLSFIGTLTLICTAGLLSTLALHFYPVTFIALLQRMKWLLLTLIVLYAFSTPGEYVQQLTLVPIRPTYEGLVAGLTQMLSIIIMLACLAMLLSTTRRAQLIGGIYQLLLPLKYLRFNPEKFAVRTWLTLHYVETRKPVMQTKTFNLEKLLAFEVNEQESYDAAIPIEVTPFGLHDYVILIGILAVYCIWIIG